MKSNHRLIFAMNLLLAVAGALLLPNQSYAQSKLIDEPRFCLARQIYPCAFRAQSLAQVLLLNDFEVHLSQGASLLLYDAKHMRLLGGQIWIRRSKELTLTTGFVDFSLNGDTWVDRVSSKKILIRNLNGSVRVSSSLSTLQEVIPVGFENWYSLINSKVHLEQGVLRSIDPLHFLPEWSAIAQLPKTQSLDLLKTYKEYWSGNVEASSHLYQDVVNRHMASFQHEEISKNLKEERKQADEVKMRQMFRARFEDR